MILFMMFMAALNFLNRNYFCIYIALAVFLLSPSRKIRLNRSVLVLICFSLSVLLFNPQSQDTLLDMIKPFAYPICYIMGFGVFQNKEGDDRSLLQAENRTATAIYIMTGGTFLHFLLNLITNWETTSRAELTDFWTRSEMSATGQAALACIALAVAIAFLFGAVGKKKKLLAVGMLLLTIVYNLILAGRMLFVMSAILIVAAFLYVTIFEKRKIAKPVVALILAFVLLIVLYAADAFGVRTAVESSNFYSRFYSDTATEEISDDLRMQHKLDYLKLFLDHPWGGSKIREILGFSAHDLYLDTYNESSIFALITIVIYIAASLARMVKCVKNKNLTLQCRLLVLCVYLVCNIEFWLEPIMRGIPWLLMAYCFIDGAVSYLLLQEENLRSTLPSGGRDTVQKLGTE